MRSEAAASREGTRRTAVEPDLDKQCIDTIRTLAIDAVEKAQSGHAGTPMGLAPVAYTLWQQFLRYDPADPLWPNRDRFVLSAGHASMLLYALLHLSGVRRIEHGRVTDDPAVSLDDIKDFRQLDSVTPGHPEYGRTPVSRPRPARSDRAAATASAWRSRRAGWRPATIGRTSSCLILMFTRSAATAT
jgi:hypothetical protein